MLAMNNLDPDMPEGAQQSTALDLRSTIAGILVSQPVAPGAWVQVGADIAVVADYAAVQVEAEVPESLIPLLGNAVGKSARISISGEPSLAIDLTGMLAAAVGVVQLPWERQRRPTAMSRAESTRLRSIRSYITQPTARQEYKSRIADTYSRPSSVAT